MTTDLLIIGIYILMGWLASLLFKDHLFHKPATKREWWLIVLSVIAVSLIWPVTIIAAVISEIYRASFQLARKIIDDYHNLPD